MSLDHAMPIWKREFDLADISADETYQFSCHGRHINVRCFLVIVPFPCWVRIHTDHWNYLQNYIFAGAIVPILNKMLKAAGVQTGTEREHDYKPYRVVRVDTSKPADNNDDEASHQEDAGQDSDEELEISPLAKIEVDPLVGGEEDVGKGVARKMTGKTGASVFRGLIVKVG